jgi:hypothetical protein
MLGNPIMKTRIWVELAKSFPPKGNIPLDGLVIQAGAVSPTLHPSHRIKWLCP